MPRHRFLKVLTWNVHGCVGTDQILDVDRTARVLSSTSAEVVALQEVDCRGLLPSGENQLARLGRRTGMETIAGPTLREGDAYFGNALLTRHVAGNVAHIDVSIEGREPRGIMHATLDIGGRRIELFNTHFGLQMRERSRQVERLLEVVEAADEAILVVLGDFNEWRPRASTLAKLRAAFGSTPAVRSFPSSFPIFALDRVWVHPRPALKRIEVLRTPLARKASDHLPVYAEIAL